MNKICEGNLYNIETEISHESQPSITGLEYWKKQVRKELFKKLKNKNIQNLNSILSQVFGKTLE